MIGAMTDVTTPTPGRLLEGTEGYVVSPGVLPGCQAVVPACIDVRFIEPLRSFLGSLGLSGDYDLACWPGGALALTTPDRPAVLDAVALACDRDQPSELVLVVHHDCDRVGGSASFPGRQAETTTRNIALAMAAESATDRFPHLRVRVARLDLERPCAVIDTHPTNRRRISTRASPGRHAGEPEHGEDSGPARRARRADGADRLTVRSWRGGDRPRSWSGVGWGLVLVLRPPRHQGRPGGAGQRGGDARVLPHRARARRAGGHADAQALRDARSSAQRVRPTGRSPEHAAVAVTAGILEILTWDELRGVLAHELSHVGNRDILIGSVAAAVATGISFTANMAMWGAMFGGGGNDEDRRSNPIALLATVTLAPIAAGLLQMALSRNREFEADRAGADLIGDGEPLARALLKLQQAAKAIPKAVQPAQASKYIVNPLTGRRVHFARLFTTHPPTEQRVVRLRQRVTGARP